MFTLGAIMNYPPDPNDPSEVQRLAQMRKALIDKGLVHGISRGAQAKLESLFREGATSGLGPDLILDLFAQGVSECDLLEIATPLPEPSLPSLIHWALEQDLSVLATGLFCMLGEDRKIQVLSDAAQGHKNTFFKIHAKNIPAQRAKFLLLSALDNDNAEAGMWLLTNSSGKTPMEFAASLRSYEHVEKLGTWWTQALAEGAMPPPKACRALSLWRSRMPALDAYLKSQKLKGVARRQIRHNEITPLRPKPRI